jgi:PhnB protein
MTTESNSWPMLRVIATPRLCVRDIMPAIKFYEEAFGAVEMSRFSASSGRTPYAYIRIGDAPIMLAEEQPDLNLLSPQALANTTVMINLLVDDVDAFVLRAVAAGATIQIPVATMFYGQRSGRIRDLFGHSWTITTPVGATRPQRYVSVGG